MLMRTAVGGKPAGTRTCRNAESHIAARCDSHSDTADGIKEISGRHEVEKLDEVTSAMWR